MEREPAMAYVPYGDLSQNPLAGIEVMERVRRQTEEGH